MSPHELLGGVLVGFSATDPEQQVAHIGEALGYLAEPSWTLVDERGHQVTWAASLTRPASAAEERGYWRARVRALEDRAQRLVELEERVAGLEALAGLTEIEVKR